MIRSILKDVAGLIDIEEAAALVSLVLFSATVLVWAEVLVR